MMNFASQKRTQSRKRRVSKRVEETDVNSSQYMTDLDGILTDGGEFKSKERAKMKRAERSRKTPQTVKKTKRQRQKADGISSKVVRAHDTPKVDLKSLQAKKKQKAAARHTWQHYLSQQAIIACRQCARRVDLSEEEATIIRVLERDFTISNCTKVLCKTCAKNPNLPKKQKCMRYCQNPEKCKSYPLVDFFIPLYCEWQKIYSLKKSHLYSSVLVPKQIQSEKQRYKNRYQLIKVENSKKKHKINELQKMRKFLIAKSRKMAENLQKAFNDNNTVESRTKQMAKYVSSVKEIYNHCNKLRERCGLLKKKYGQAKQYKSSLVEKIKKMRL